jgi:broad specificity phosphatase PhoE
MPNRIVFIRHGESEANIVQKLDKRGESVISAEGLAVRKRADYRQRLSKKGITQAIQAREWVNKNIYEIGKFDSYFVSSFFRARETAAIISANNEEIKWEIDDRLAERSWGVHGPLTIAEREKSYKETNELMSVDPLHIAFEGGESIWGVKNQRIRNLMGTWAREQNGKSILIVTHGDLMRAARVGFERILPEEFESIENNPVYKVKNCQCLEYSRFNPFTGQDEGKIKWRRITNSTEPETSPNNGNWIELRDKPKFSSKQMLEKIKKDAPNLIKKME